MEEITNRESRKKALRRQSTEYKEAIETQVKEGYNEVQRTGRLMLIGGIVGLGAYTIFSLLGSKRPNVNRRKAQSLEGSVAVGESSVSKLIKEKIALFLLSMALERLKTHLLKTKPNDDTTDPRESSPAAEDQD